MISIKTLKEEYLIDDNLEDKYILPIIKKGQDFIITPLLGLTKTNELLSQIEAGTVTTQNNELIKNYIQPILAYYCLSEVVYATAYKMKNIGLEDVNTDRYNELVKISSKYLRDSQQYEQILREYICRTGIILPITIGEEPRESGFKTGIYIG